MNNTFQQRIRQTTAVLVALALVFSVFGPVGVVMAAPDVSVSHAQGSVTAAPGDEVQITATFEQTDANSPAMVPLLPDGWSITATTAADGWTYFESQTTFLGGFDLSDGDGVSGTYTHTYTVLVPSDAAPGEYTVTSEGSVIVPATSERLTGTASTTIVVEEPVVNPANFQVSNLNPMDATVTQGDVIDVSASVENTGDVEGTQTVEFQVDGQVLADEEVTLASGASQTVTFENIDTSSLAPGDHTHGVHTQDSSQTATLTVEAPPTPGNFQVSNLDPMDVTVTQGDVIQVSALVENTGDESATQTVEFQVDGQPLAQEEVILAGGASQTVTFENIDTSSLAPGDHTHGVYTQDDSQTATLTVEEQPTTGISSAVSLSPVDAEVTIGESQDYSVVVENADGGVGAYTAVVTVDDPSVATITDVTLLGSPSSSTTEVDIATDGSSATITAALMNTDDTGSVPIAVVEVTGQTEGASDLSLSVSALGNEQGESYAVTATSGASVSVVDLAPIGNFAESPNDMNGDGIYEDTNGDGVFNIVDIQATFANMDDPVIQNNNLKFDYNGDGKFDVVDVQAQYNMLINGGA